MLSQRAFVTPGALSGRVMEWVRASFTATMRISVVLILEITCSDVVFENHDHAYKRTKPMLASGPSTTGNGTIHVGDGNWGLDDGMRIPQLRNYNDVVSRSAFVLQVVVNDTALSARALGSNNEAFDSFTITGFDP